MEERQITPEIEQKIKELVDKDLGNNKDTVTGRARNFLIQSYKKKYLNNLINIEVE